MADQQNFSGNFQRLPQVLTADVALPSNTTTVIITFTMGPFPQSQSGKWTGFFVAWATVLNGAAAGNVDILLQATGSVLFANNQAASTLNLPASVTGSLSVGITLRAGDTETIVVTMFLRPNQTMTAKANSFTLGASSATGVAGFFESNAGYNQN